MSLTRAEIVMEFYPRWKSTPALIELCEQALRHYSPEQVRAATGQVRIENASSSDPNIKAIVAQIRGDRLAKPDAGYHSAHGQAAIPIRPETDEDRQFSRMLDSWRLDIRTESRKPGFDFIAYRDRMHKRAAQDLAPFGITEPRSIDHMLRRCGSEVGVCHCEAVPRLNTATLRHSRCCCGA